MFLGLRADAVELKQSTWNGRVAELATSFWDVAVRSSQATAVGPAASAAAVGSAIATTTATVGPSTSAGVGHSSWQCWQPSVAFFAPLRPSVAGPTAATAVGRGRAAIAADAGGRTAVDADAGVALVAKLER